MYASRTGRVRPYPCPDPVASRGGLSSARVTGAREIPENERLSHNFEIDREDLRAIRKIKTTGLCDRPRARRSPRHPEVVHVPRGGTLVDSMAKSHLIHIRCTEPELARIAALPRHPADRSDSDTYRRLLAFACQQLERQLPAGDGEPR
jgi:hypothetical protein